MWGKINNEIKIALITDSNYFLPALVAIESLTANTSEQLNVRCILTKNVEYDIKQIEQNLKQKYKNLTLEFIYFDDSKLGNIQTKFHISKAAYIKIYLPDILSDWNTCIFLDSDMLVCKDVSQLWSIATTMKEEQELGAVWNPGYIKDNEFIGVKDDEKTFNSGLLIMNLKAMRKNSSSEQLKLFIKDFNSRTHLNDQPAFNSVFKYKWLEIPLEWNVQFQFFVKSNKKIGITKEQLREVKKNPAIVHFTTASKPWKYRSVHPFKKQYLAYQNEYIELIEQENVDKLDFLKKLREKVLIAFYNIMT